MKKLLLCIILSIVSIALCAQDCKQKVEAAKKLFDEEQYELAQKQFELVIRDCGENYGGAKKFLDECKKKILENSASLNVGKNKITFCAAGGKETVSVNSKNCTWKIGKHPDWIEVTKSGNNLIINCDVNRTSDDRSATIGVVGDVGDLKQSIRVLQNKGVLSVSDENISFQSKGGTRTIIVESNMDWIIDSQYNSWIKTSQSGNAITVSCGENTSVDKKKGSFTIRTSNGDYKRITVEQDGAKVFLDIPQRLNYSGNGGKTSITIKTNASDWYVSNVGTLSWCKASKRGDKELYIEVQSNPITSPRSTYVKVCVKNVYKDITITQDAKGGYAGLLDDYFDYVDGTRKISFFEINLYAFGNYGVRMSSMMYRWKFAEIDFLNMNFGIAPQLSIDWEPMVRGYLPFTSDGRCWAAYIGLGGRVNLYESSWDYETYIDNSSSIVFETGVEYHWERSDNTSTRLFIRYDGAISLGIAFDMYKWNY